MLSVMDKYGPMADLEVFKVRNLSMGSILILLPFMPNVRVLAFKYTQQAEESASNITDDLFRKIFKKNEFKVGLPKCKGYPRISSLFFHILGPGRVVLVEWNRGRRYCGLVLEQRSKVEENSWTDSMGYFRRGTHEDLAGRP